MSELGLIIQGINSIGFPIVSFLLMYNFATKTMRENTAAINELRVVIKGNK